MWGSVGAPGGICSARPCRRRRASAGRRTACNRRAAPIFLARSAFAEFAKRTKKIRACSPTRAKGVALPEIDPAPPPPAASSGAPGGVGRNLPGWGQWPAWGLSEGFFSSATRASAAANVVRCCAAYTFGARTRRPACSSPAGRTRRTYHVSASSPGGWWQFTAAGRHTPLRPI